MTPKELASKANSIAGDIDSRRWQLAELALQARSEGLQNWALIIAQLPSVRKSARSIEQWARTADFRSRLSHNYDLPFSFYARAAEKEKVLSIERLDEAMAAFESEHRSVDEFSHFLSGLAGKHDPALGDLLDAEIARLIRIAQGVDDRVILDHIEDAIEHLRQALAWLEGRGSKTEFQYDRGGRV